MTLGLKLISIFFVLLIFLHVLILIRQKKLTDEFATLWIVSSILLLAGSIFSEKIFEIYKFIKGDTGSGLSILLLLAIVLIIVLIVILTSHISIHHNQIKNITQKIGLIDNHIRKFEEDDKKKK